MVIGVTCYCFFFFYATISVLLQLKTISKACRNNGFASVNSKLYAVACPNPWVKHLVTTGICTYSSRVWARSVLLTKCQRTRICSIVGNSWINDARWTWFNSWEIPCCEVTYCIIGWKNCGSRHHEISCVKMPTNKVEVCTVNSYQGCFEPTSIALRSIVWWSFMRWTSSTRYGKRRTIVQNIGCWSDVLIQANSSSSMLSSPNEFYQIPTWRWSRNAPWLVDSIHSVLVIP